jgi:hypothetical protein
MVINTSITKFVSYLPMSGKSDRQFEEVELTRRLLNTLGHKDVTLARNDKPDVLARIDGRRIGIEVTVFHADEAIDCNGSKLREAEEKEARKAPDGPYSSWGVANPLSGLQARIADKIVVSAAYDASSLDEMWLLIIGQFPKSGALASTFISPIFVSIKELNQHFDATLRRSRFDTAYLHLSLHQITYGWSPNQRWQLQSSEIPEASRATLSLRKTLDDSGWLRTPEGKARAEAHKALDELIERRYRSNDDK